MAVISIPNSAYFDSVDALRLQRAGMTMRSRYTGKRQSIVFPFSMWVLEGTLIDMDGQDAADWRSFLAQLEGTTNTFKLPVPGVTSPLSGYNSTANLVANGTFTTNTNGWTVLVGGTIAVVSGKLRLTSNTSGTMIVYQAIPTVVGKSYTLSATIAGGTMPNPTVSAATNVDRGGIAGLAATGTITFTAITTTTYILVYGVASASGQTADFDDIVMTGYLYPQVGAAGAAVNASSMPIVAGASVSVLKNGDYFTVNDELKVCTANCSTDGSGNATLTFEPALRQAVTSGMLVWLENPYILLAASDNDQAGWGLAHPVLHKIKLKAVEAF